MGIRNIVLAGSLLLWLWTWKLYWKPRFEVKTATTAAALTEGIWNQPNPLGDTILQKPNIEHTIHLLDSCVRWWDRNIEYITALEEIDSSYESLSEADQERLNVMIVKYIKKILEKDLARAANIESSGKWLITLYIQRLRHAYVLAKKREVDMTGDIQTNIQDTTITEIMDNKITYWMQWVETHEIDLTGKMSTETEAEASMRLLWSIPPWWK